MAMNPIQRFWRSLGPAGATANARRSCDELRLRSHAADAIDRRFAPGAGPAAARPAATASARVA